MLKIAAIVSLMLIGSTLWAAGLSCDSCGSECASACGTRHFRSCCFNYLRRKRGPESLKFWTPNNPDLKTENQNHKLPNFLVETIPEPWNTFVSNEYRPYADDDHLQFVYEI